jgi:hypothetical protein
MGLASLLQRLTEMRTATAGNLGRNCGSTKQHGELRQQLESSKVFIIPNGLFLRITLRDERLVLFVYWYNWQN